MKKILHLDDIVADEEIQSRCGIDHACVERYCEDHRNGAKFEPLKVLYGPGDKGDPARHWLWDGFHRHYMYRIVGTKEVEVECEDGSKRDAKLKAAGANAVHGLQRSRADKERSVLQLLNDPEWREHSIDWIADQAKVGVAFADRIRREYFGMLEKPKVDLFKNQKPPEVESEPEDETVEEVIEPVVEEEDDPSAPKVFDSYKRPVPRALHPVFGHKREFELIIKDAIALKKRTQQALEHPSRTGQTMSQSKMMYGLSVFNDEIENNLVSVVCPGCEGRDAGICTCELCGDRRWLTTDEVAKLPLKWRRKIESWLEAGRPA